MSRLRALGCVCLLLVAACRDSGRPASTSFGDVESTFARSRSAHVEGSRINVYAGIGANSLSAVAAKARPLVYVPNSLSASVSVIDPATYKVVRTFRTGAIPQHVVPAYDLARLWVLNNKAGTVVPIDPVTGSEGPAVRVDDPYNMYFTPDGRFAIVVAEKRQRLDFLDPQTMQRVETARVDCKGIDHIDFTADGRSFIATCEFSGKLMKFDLSARKVVGYLGLESAARGRRAMPQDIRSSPDGRVFYVADMMADGVHLIDPVAFRQVGFLATGRGTHGITPSRDGRRLYVANRGWNTIVGGHRGPGSVTVIDPATRSIVGTWPIPGGGSPDMGNVSVDGKELWLSGRYDDEVYVFDTAQGKLTHRIRVGRQPHGLCIWPQPGHYSLGHTGNMR